MALYLIGLGLGSSGHVTLKAVKTVEKLGKLYLDSYTSFIEQALLEELEERFGEKLVKADRRLLEEMAQRIVEEARDMDVGILVPGDPLIATTHISLLMEAAKKKVPYKIVHGLSAFCALVSASGLHAYKFGKITTIPKSGLGIETCYRTIEGNMERGLHSLILLDTADGGLTIPDALKMLLKAEDNLGLGLLSEERLVICLARIGFEDEFKWAGKINDAIELNYPPPPHSIIIPGELHFSEIEVLKTILHADPSAVDQHKPVRFWRSRTKRYLENVEDALKSMKQLSDEAVVKELVGMADSYLEDAKRFWESGDLFDALAAVSYAEGILDALRSLRKIDFSWKR